MTHYQCYDRQQVYEEKYRQFMDLEVPPCTLCGSTNMASVQVGVIGLAIRHAATCPKFKLIPSSPKPAA